MTPDNDTNEWHQILVLESDTGDGHQRVTLESNNREWRKRVILDRTLESTIESTQRSLSDPYSKSPIVYQPVFTQ